MLLKGLKLRDIDEIPINRQSTFTLFNPNGRNISVKHKELDLLCESINEIEVWKTAFLRAGVHAENDPQPHIPIEDVSKMVYIEYFFA